MVVMVLVCGIEDREPEQHVADEAGDADTTSAAKPTTRRRKRRSGRRSHGRTDITAGERSDRAEGP
jgi:hypothetical protein